jgi:hypothetical protein
VQVILLYTESASSQNAMPPQQKINLHLFKQIKFCFLFFILFLC